MTYETIIGLEVHVELKTDSKIFCGCPTKFGAGPNTQTCPVCTGMPGTLPALNKKAVALAIRAGLALNCSITRENRFDRKNYFYPDLPKAYQISQLYYPICREGYLEIEDGKIGILEIHLEEDAGKLIHDPWQDCSLVDYNRCGVPLIEIVTKPDFRSAGQVVIFLEKLREILLYLDISDCRMQEGSMRADINLSLRPRGQTALGTRTEMKNMNSFKAIHRAIISESRRQAELLDEGKTILQETRRWDDSKGASFPMRSKEEAHDYRYFPEPDILPVFISEAWIRQTQAEMPQTAEEKRDVFVKEYGLSPYDAAILTAEKPLCILFEETTAICGCAKEVSNQITGEIMRLVKETGADPGGIRITPSRLAAIITMVTQGKINRTAAKAALEKTFKTGDDPVAYIKQAGLMMVDDSQLITDAVQKVLISPENQKSLQDYADGKEKAFGYLVGQAMKALKGRANPKTVTDILKAALESEAEQ